ncbi:PAS domain S-box protein [Mucilaginibacter terrenus]|uniref:PAS domain S-box protein n=1 Tax=Mucilaginibacter terrenus TaxID=2482727 RepID=A0A3E2NTU0_9SPHI|nr:GAF domain-containing protein [Mucilaginibacter terrenus]RFZ84426.1 PAS domain S-box protein [Mucilaginibacter terrenus]
MPLRELERLAAVNRFLNLNFSKENEVQELVNLAAEVCNTPIALVTLLSEDTQHIRFKVGLDKKTTAREDAFCNHVITQDDFMMVGDASLDNRFVDNPLVTGDPNIRFYAGAPLTTQDGYTLGSLCVIDKVPNQLSDLQQKTLKALSKQVIHLLEFDVSIKLLKEQFIEAKRSEIELRSFFESSIDCHWLLGKEFELLAFNKSLERHMFSQYNKVLERGRSMADYLTPEILKEFYLNYQRALKGTAAFEQRRIDYSSRTVWWLIKYEPAFDPDGFIIGVSINATDVTTRVEHEHTVNLQNQSLREIAFIQSHELRRPVASILGLMNLLKNDERLKDIEEITLMEKAALELDEKIHLVVGYTA